MRAFLSRLFHSKTFRLAAVLQITLVWSIPAICGEIHDAAGAGDLTKVKALLKDNPDLVFSKKEDLRLDKTVRIIGDEIGYDLTPLHSAAESGYKEVVELLLVNKADVNAKTDNGYTPLHTATLRDHKDMAELLLAHGAEVNAKDSEGWTPLHGAAANGHKDMVELLLAHGAEVNAKDDNVTTLYVAAMQGDLVKVKALLNSNPDLVSSKDKYGEIPLYWAVQFVRKDIIELLLANKANVNTKDRLSGDTPLHIAAKYGHKDMAELLLANKADVNIKGRLDGWTPLHNAAFRGHKDVVELLLAYGADVNTKDNQGGTPLHRAAQGNRKDVAELLLAKGADINAKNKLGHTPLSIAVIFAEIWDALDLKDKDRNKGIIEFLRQHGGHE